MIVAHVPGHGSGPQASVTTSDALRRLAERGDQDGWEATTEHALLVVLGEFARHVGLVDRLRGVPLGQQTRHFSPQDKLIQMLVGILAGLDYLQDFTQAAQPLVKDTVVASSWGQVGFAHQSGVSRTLAVADEATLAGIVAALDAVSKPFRQHEVVALMRSGRPLMLDVDLTGRPVSPTSTTFPGAEFGWMGEEVGKGYQAALTSLSGGPTGRLLLSAARYDGRTHSAECLQAAVRSMEDKLGVRPRRRTELVAARAEAQRTAIATAAEALGRRQTRLASLEAEHGTAAEAVTATETALDALWIMYRHEGRPETPHSRLARARRRWRYAQTRLERTGQAVLTHRARLEQAERHLAGLETEYEQTQARLARLEQDNAEAACCMDCQLRIDAGFSTAENLAWSIEMGYDVLSKAHSPQTTERLVRSLAPQTTWQRVGNNAEAVYLGAQLVADCPYAVHCLLVRYHLPTGYRHTTLLYYGAHPPTEDLVAWFDRYNGRQIIEAGIKEGKTVFPMRRPWVRSDIGMEIQEQFSLFAANFVRWAAQWASQCIHQANQRMTDALREVKTLVRTVAHARANIVVSALGRTLIFDDHGPFAGAVMCLSGSLAYQRVLPFFHRPGPSGQSGAQLRNR